MRSPCVLAGVVCLLSPTVFAQYDEARDMTRVTIDGVRSDPKTSDEGGCGTTGCRHSLLYDGSLDAESRWSCQEPLDPDSYDECAVFFYFYEPQHMGSLKIAFYNGDTRQRTVTIVYEVADEYGDPGAIVHVGDFTSSGTTTDFEEVPISEFPLVETEGVISVTIVAASSTPYNQWLSITEVSLGVFGVTCEDANPNQSCADDLADRNFALSYLSMTDDELWGLLVNGKGVGLCNIHVANGSEETDLYAYSGVLQAEGNHGYPDGVHAGYVSTPDWPSGSPGAADVCSDYNAMFPDSDLCTENGRSNAVLQIRHAIKAGHCCLSY